MRKLWLVLALTLLASADVLAGPIILDFSSGTYSSNRQIYTESSFDFVASHGFHSVDLGTLAWYETSNLITVSSADGLFSLEALDIVNPAYAGLVFTSSRGGQIGVGSGANDLSFSDENWMDIESFTISTRLTSFDILNQLDNISVSLTSASVSEPPTIFLLVLGILLLLRSSRKSGSGNSMLERFSLNRRIS